MSNITIGTGPDGIILEIAEDAYLGDAQYTISVDGKQIGGVQTASALQSVGQEQQVIALGNFGAGMQTVTVDFLNDAYGGSPSADRNLYVDSIYYYGVSYAGSPLYSAGFTSFVIGQSFHVTDSASLNAAIDAADAAMTGDIVIQLANSITETTALDAINLHSGVTLTIDGIGYTLNGANTYRGLFAYAGTLDVQNLAIVNTVAIGGAGGGQGAGGGAGLGGGLFVAGTNAGQASGASVTLNNVTFGSDQAVGGAGNGGGGMFEGNLGPYGTGGGGGGLGGNGGSYALGGGGGGGIGGGGGTGGAGTAGIVPGAAGGGSAGIASNPNSPLPSAGGANGGGGGGGGFEMFGAGGGGGVGGGSGAAELVGAQAGAGGFGGGGGGGGQPGGNGGFGGGGGSAGGNGGFGGGGADNSASAGFGGGVGSSPNTINYFGVFDGGGGMGAGGAVFVQQGGALTIEGGLIGGGLVAGGVGGIGAGETVAPAIRDGLGLGSGIFLQGNQTVTFNEGLGQSGSITDVIADQTGSGGTGANAGGGIVSVTGLGVVMLMAVNTYSGGTLLGGGTLELGNAQAAGTGVIAFTGAADATLQIDIGILANTVSGFALGDSIDFVGLPYNVSASAVFSGQVLSIGSTSLTLTGVTSGTQFTTAADAHGGVLVTEVAEVVAVGSGPDTIDAYISEDAYQGDAEFTVSVNSHQIGGVQTATSLHASGQDELFAISGDFGSVAPTLTVNFLNDLYAGTPTTDRNLYVDSINSSGIATISNAALYSAGPASFILPAPAPVATVVGSGPDSIGLQISEDAYAAYGGKDAQFTVAVDGTQIGGILEATAAHALGDTQLFSMLGSFGTGSHTVSVDFLNDAYDGTPTTDRNLYVGAITNGGVTSTFNAALYSQGSQTFQV